MRAAAYWTRFLGARALVALAALLGSGCSNALDRLPPDVDCSVLDNYDFNVIFPFETGDITWYGYGDETPGSYPEDLESVNPADNVPPRCGSVRSMLLSNHHHNDWGAGFGEYGISMNIGTEEMPDYTFADASQYDGVSFWARSPGPTTKGFLFNLADSNTYANGLKCIDAQTIVAEGGEGYTTNQGGQQVPIGRELAGPNDCGNTFQRVVTVTDEWQLYTLPFSTFSQQALPNLRPEGMDTTHIYQFSITVPKESEVELWVDDLGFYRPRAANAAAP